jgi:hypothetical protein
MAGQEEIAMEEEAAPHDRLETAPENVAELLEEREAASSPADPDGESAPADNEAPVDKASVDGRLSSLPPDYSADDADDPSAEEGRIQSEEGSS